MIVYLIGSLRNPKIPQIANSLQALLRSKRRYRKAEVFCSWAAAGKIADDSWRDYEKARGSTYPEAIHGYAAQHVFNFDLQHLKRATHGVLVMPAGKSAHLELGWLIGQGKPGYILLDKEPARWDVMVNFAQGVYLNIEDLGKAILHD